DDGRPTGEQHLFRPVDSDLAPFETDGALRESIYSRIAQRLGIPAPEVVIAKIDQRVGSLQRVSDGPSSAWPGVFIPSYHPNDLPQLLKIQILDWVVGYRDAHTGNFVRNSLGELVPIDREAIGIIGAEAVAAVPNHFTLEDALDVDFDPMAGYQAVYPTMWQDFVAGKIELPDPRAGELADFIERLQSVGKEGLESLIRPYLINAEARGRRYERRSAPQGDPVDVIAARLARVGTEFAEHWYDEAVRLRAQPKGDVPPPTRGYFFGSSGAETSPLLLESRGLITDLPGLSTNDAGSTVNCLPATWALLHQFAGGRPRQAPDQQGRQREVERFLGRLVERGYSARRPDGSYLLRPGQRFDIDSLQEYVASLPQGAEGVVFVRYPDMPSGRKDQRGTLLRDSKGEPLRGLGHAVAVKNHQGRAHFLDGQLRKVLHPKAVSSGIVADWQLPDPVEVGPLPKGLSPHQERAWKRDRRIAAIPDRPDVEYRFLRTDDLDDAGSIPEDVEMAVVMSVGRDRSSIEVIDPHDQRLDENDKPVTRTIAIAGTEYQRGGPRPGENVYLTPSAVPGADPVVTSQSNGHWTPPASASATLRTPNQRSEQAPDWLSQTPMRGPRAVQIGSLAAYSDFIGREEQVRDLIESQLPADAAERGDINRFMDLFGRGDMRTLLVHASGTVVGAASAVRERDGRVRLQQVFLDSEAEHLVAADWAAALGAPAYQLDASAATPGRRVERILTDRVEGFELRLTEELRSWLSARSDAALLGVDHLGIAIPGVTLVAPSADDPLAEPVRTPMSDIGRVVLGRDLGLEWEEPVHFGGGRPVEPVRIGEWTVYRDMAGQGERMSDFLTSQLPSDVLPDLSWSDRQVLIQDQAGTVVALATANDIGPDRAYLSAVYLHPDYEPLATDAAMWGDAFGIGTIDVHDAGLVSRVKQGLLPLVRRDGTNPELVVTPEVEAWLDDLDQRDHSQGAVLDGLRSLAHLRGNRGLTLVIGGSGAATEPVRIPLAEWEESVSGRFPWRVDGDHPNDDDPDDEGPSGGSPVAGSDPDGGVTPSGGDGEVESVPGSETVGEPMTDQGNAGLARLAGSAWGFVRELFAGTEQQPSEHGEEPQGVPGAESAQEPMDWSSASL
ncbi:MAG: hypothetical protein ACRCYQ_15130, partial [Nocardioides sp.]